MPEHIVETRVGGLTVQLEGSASKPAASLWHSLFLDERTWGRVVPEPAANRRLVVVTSFGAGRRR